MFNSRQCSANRDCGIRLTPVYDITWSDINDDIQNCLQSQLLQLSLIELKKLEHMDEHIDLLHWKKPDLNTYKNILSWVDTNNVVLLFLCTSRCFESDKPLKEINLPFIRKRNYNNNYYNSYNWIIVVEYLYTFY